jgi:hypothetical protein
MITLTREETRQLAVSSQYLAQHTHPPDANGMYQVIRRLGCVQLDPIRAVERSPLLVLWSRLGTYDPAVLDHLMWEERKLFEFWAHAASIVLTENYSLHQGQMRRFASGERTMEQRVRSWMEINDEFRQHIIEQLSQNGAMLSKELNGDLCQVPWESSGWTHGQDVTRMLDFMWFGGSVTVAGRQGSHRKWGLMERILPETKTAARLSNREITREAVQIALRALGVGTAKHIKNHFIRGYYKELNSVLKQLVKEGVVLPAQVTDVKRKGGEEWYILASELPLLEKVRAGNFEGRTVLLSPFDNLICDRDRTELLWDFYFRIEIYVPKAKREYGYYVLPILHNETLVGRIDMKTDRKSRKLIVFNVYAEPDAPTDAEEGIASTLHDLAVFVGAESVTIDAVAPVWSGLADRAAGPVGGKIS